ncbi:hypothetical protein NE237_018979 [Protea cynaroides]|uniref:Uncharacterized protein n=1 Tax=Protea cynaroides TaxID=273540 RepID=A0A9Q0KB06_9MAGN|nr:hypothetical protein NE237_018979 [Protea cynaroides]
MQTKRAKAVLLQLGRTMEYFLAILALSSLLLITSSVDARKDPAEYWKDVMKDQPMPEVIQGLLLANPESLPKEKTDCHTPMETQKLEKFNWDVNLQSSSIIYHGHDENKEDKTPMKDFELNSSDPTGEKKSFEKVFEPRPNKI